MISKRAGALCAAIGLTLGLGACTDGYGYNSLAVGYGGGGGDYYEAPYNAGYGYDGYGYGQSNFGWYGDYFYPGVGVYVYDSYRRPYRWNGAQQRYWQGRRRYRGRDWNGQGAWSGFDRGGAWQGRGDGRTWQGQPGQPGRLNGSQYRDSRSGSVPGSRDYRARPRGQDYRGGANGGSYRGNRGIEQVNPDGARAMTPQGGDRGAPAATAPRGNGGGWAARGGGRGVGQTTSDERVRPD